MQFTPKDRRDLQRREANSFADEIKQQVQSSQCIVVIISSSQLLFLSFVLFGRGWSMPDDEETTSYSSSGANARGEGT